MNEERCKRLEERQAATEERLTALESRAEGCITQDEYRARLASLRAPGVEIPSEPVDVAEMQAQIHEADMDRIAASERLNAANAALATARRERDAYRKAKEENDERFMTERDDARRERDEAVAIVRDWLVWRSVHHVSDVHFPDLASVLSRARALVAGQAAPDPRDAEIATLRTSLAEARGEVARLNKTVAERNGHIRAQCALMDEWRNGRNAAEADRDALRTRLDEALGIMRAVEALGTCRRPCSHPVCLVITRARFLVAGQTGLPADALCCCGHALAAHQGHTVVAGQPEPTHCAECRSCRSFAEAPKRETIAALRTQLAERGKP